MKTTKRLKMFNKEIIDRLKNAGIDNYLFEAKIIEEHVKKNNLSVIDLEDIIKRRENREPLQYILGEWEFYGDIYKLNKDCLIPRPESEFLTEYIIENAGQNGIVLDLCSGSGCISVSALKRRKDLSAVLIDIAHNAIEISKENAKINGVFDRIEFYCFDIIKDYEKILEFLKSPLPRRGWHEVPGVVFSLAISDSATPTLRAPPSEKGALKGDIDIIVSNPPYLTKSEIELIKSEKTELYYEPESALLGGEDGLDFYRFIINNYSQAFDVGRGDPGAPRKISTVTVFECGINQSKDIVMMFEKIGFSCDIIRDYNKIERVVAGRKI
ncbi:MAG: peptide chain release factor N(5)-glutamine methyltransferase [Oscillospiraceae bacterium]|nr:peptide chain release factor N(5)-glutamine methyltransferase [Oscillospiraceae bacterium]